MNKKGFTLVELLVVIALLGMLAVIATPAVLTIRKNMLDNALKSKKEQIREAALDYGSKNIMRIPGDPRSQSDIDNNIGYSVYNETNITHNEAYCLRVKVGTLISEGYLLGDDSTKEMLINPINNEPLNFEYVCIRYDSNDALNRKLVAYIISDVEGNNETE